jgi:hypothetical protein
MAPFDMADHRGRHGQTANVYPKPFHQLPQMPGKEAQAQVATVAHVILYCDRKAISANAKDAINYGALDDVTHGYLP